MLLQTSESLKNNIFHNTSNKELDRAFISALAVRLEYARKTQRGGGPWKATFSQVAAIAERQSGVKLHPPQIERLKRKYVGRPGKPATCLELIRQVKTGKVGVPSEFEITGLAEYLAS